MLGQFLFPEGLNGFHEGFAAAFQSVRLLVVLDVTGDIGRQADGHAFGVLVSHVFILTFIRCGLRRSNSGSSLALAGKSGAGGAGRAAGAFTPSFDLFSKLI